MQETVPVRFYRADPDHVEFRKLVALLDTELALRDGDDHAFYHRFNGIDKPGHCVLGRSGQVAIACGGPRRFRTGTMEVQRMRRFPI